MKLSLCTRSRSWWLVVAGILFVLSIALGGVIAYRIIAGQTDPVTLQGITPDQVKNESTDSSTPTTTVDPTTSPIPNAGPHNQPADMANQPILQRRQTQLSQREISFTPAVAGEQYNQQKDAINSVTSQTHKAFKDNDSHVLYDLFSSQLTSMFTADNLAEAFGAKGEVDLQPIGDPIISTEWAKQQVSYTSNGTTTGYDMILHLENGEWKLFGTMDSATALP
jgi:hypothetical protein